MQLKTKLNLQFLRKTKKHKINLKHNVKISVLHLQVLDMAASPCLINAWEPTVKPLHEILQCVRNILWTIETSMAKTQICIDAHEKQILPF